MAVRYSTTFEREGLMKKSEVARLERFVDFLYEQFNGELTGPYVDWALAMTDFRAFAAGYIAEFKKREE